jgi:hypothetical protein
MRRIRLRAGGTGRRVAIALGCDGVSAVRPAADVNRGGNRTAKSVRGHEVGEKLLASRSLVGETAQQKVFVDTHL